MKAPVLRLLIQLLGLKMRVKQMKQCQTCEKNIYVFNPTQTYSSLVNLATLVVGCCQPIVGHGQGFPVSQSQVPVVPHKAVAEVSKIANL